MPSDEILLKGLRITRRGGLSCSSIHQGLNDPFRGEKGFNGAIVKALVHEIDPDRPSKLPGCLVGAERATLIIAKPDPRHEAWGIPKEPKILGILSGSSLRRHGPSHPLSHLACPAFYDTLQDRG
jgi:hypothetical protein